MKTYQVTQQLSWACPNMLIFVNDDNHVIGHQTNPDNALTQQWAEDGEDWGLFNPSEYKECKEVAYPLAA